METKANYLMIGGFVLGVLAFAFIFVFWMSNFAGGGKRYYVVFESSVSGLTTGSSVGFQGLKVGEVQSFSRAKDLELLDERYARGEIAPREEKKKKKISARKNAKTSPEND